jgi:hypothetical protein
MEGDHSLHPRACGTGSANRSITVRLLAMDHCASYDHGTVYNEWWLGYGEPELEHCWAYGTDFSEKGFSNKSKEAC